MSARERQPTCVLLLPAPLERFILRDHAEDLLRAPGVVAVDPPRLPYGAFGRLPAPLGDALAARQAQRLVRSLRSSGAEPRAIVIFHALQYQLARAVAALCGDCELWYWRWDRYEVAYDASARMRRRIEHLHEAAAKRATTIVAVNDALAQIERDAGRDAIVVPLAADAFPSALAGEVVAISLGHLGRRTDWSLLRGVAERLGERLTLLLVGARHDDECRGDGDFEWCTRAPGFVWLGAQDDEAAARLILCADVGIVPFARHPFNEAALPYRVLKYARLGRRTVAPPLAGLATWSEAVTFADSAEEFATALLAHAGARSRPDERLRAWALAQTATRLHEPLWRRLAELGVDIGDAQLGQDA